MVIQPKKDDYKKIHICFGIQWLNKVTITYPFLTPFVDEIIDKVASHE